MLLEHCLRSQACSLGHRLQDPDTTSSAYPGRLANAFNASRRPLVGEFNFYGNTLFIIANHRNSKGGDDPLFGRFQPPTFPSENQRPCDEYPHAHANLHQHTDNDHHADRDLDEHSDSHLEYCRWPGTTHVVVTA